MLIEHGQIDEIGTIKLHGRGFMCWVPNCEHKGKKGIITVDESAEAEVWLCEKHWEEAKAAGQ